jgi:hypothetical protein
LTDGVVAVEKKSLFRGTFFYIRLLSPLPGLLRQMPLAPLPKADRAISLAVRLSALADAPLPKAGRTLSLAVWLSAHADADYLM